MNKSNFSYTLKISLVLLLICAAVAGVVSFVYGITNEQYQKNLAQEEIKALESIFSEEGLEFKKEDVSVYYTAVNGLNSLYTVLNQNGEAVGYCINISGNGYGGMLNLIAGYNADGSIKKIQVVSHAETPGVGTKATEDGGQFLAQYAGKQPSQLVIDEDVDAVSGATVSSRSINLIINEANKLADYLVNGTELITPEQKKELSISSIFFEEGNITKERLDDRDGADALYAVYADGEHIGYAVDISESGYHGPMVLIIGYDTKGSIKGIKVISHHETEGYGSLVVDEKGDFLPQYIGKDGQLSVEPEGGDIDAVAGATSSSQTVGSVINRASMIVKNIIEGGVK